MRAGPGPRLAATVVFLLLALLPLRTLACNARDFLTLPLPESTGRGAVAASLELAYPGLSVQGGSVRFEDGTVLPLGDDRGLAARDRLQAPTIAEQFTDRYPLAFDLTLRDTPWFDPGRARNDAFFRSLHAHTAAEVSEELTQVPYPGAGRSIAFAATTRHCVAPQLEAALAAINAQGASMVRYLEGAGGGFNWRVIAGTDRLSAHSFGIAVDFNTELGGYWRWSGRAEGNAGAYDNRFPEGLVTAMERYGFIWGGKWHHFDGMHFEYRPELILYSRLTASAPFAGD